MCDSPLQFCVRRAVGPATARGIPAADSAQTLATASLNALPGEKPGRVLAGIATLSPVRGLRPSRAERCRGPKVPNPTIATFCPSATVSVMTSNTKSVLPTPLKNKALFLCGRTAHRNRMPRYATAADHLSSEELKQRYRDSTDPIESRRYHLVWLVQQGWSLKKAAKVVGLNYDYAQEVLKAYNQEGESALRNRLKDLRPPGVPPLLNQQQQEKLRQRLQEPPDDGGVWTGPKVAQWIAQQTGREQVWPQRGWDYLKRLGFSWQRPRPRHTNSDPQAQEAFKQELAERLEQ